MAGGLGQAFALAWSTSRSLEGAWSFRGDAGLMNLPVEPELGLVTCRLGQAGAREWQYQP